MLTRLRFKNWRSLRDVEIDNLTPITVFIGANSSGKSNLLDALFFLRQAISSDDPFQALEARSWEENVRTIGVSEDEPIELEFTFLSGSGNGNLTYSLTENQRVDENGTTYWFDERLVDDSGFVWLETTNGPAIDAKAKRTKQSEWEIISSLSGLALSALGRAGTYPSIQQTFLFVTQRWQMLDENFFPPVRIGKTGERFMIDRCAVNVAVMLEFMQSKHPDLYRELQADLSWLLGHVSRLDTEMNDQETRFLIKEGVHQGREAPTISAGTARLVAMLTAYYALDMRSPELPGLVVIEEPDTSLHPLLLSKFVTLLRNYQDRKEPRQFILTTHNPELLDYFEPEEVRVVERDEETGETYVDTIPDYIKEIWLLKHTLGEAWTNRVLGGVPEP